MKLATYSPLIGLVALSVLLAWLNAFLMGDGSFDSTTTLRWSMVSMGYFLAGLAFLKLVDIGAFVTSFLQYDLLSQRVPVYGYCYPVLELAVALAILAGLWPLGTGLLAMLLGTLGGISIVYQRSSKAKDEPLSCACTGGHLKLPLGLVSILENLMMVLMGVLLIFSALS